MALLEAVLFSSFWSFGLGQLTLEQPEVSVTGTREKSVIMSCKVFSKDFSKDYIHWYRQKPDQGLEQLLYVLTTPALSHSGGTKNKLEAKKDVSSSTSTLRISFLQKEDEAMYYCAGWVSAHSDSAVNLCRILQSLTVAMQSVATLSDTVLTRVSEQADRALGLHLLVAGVTAATLSGLNRIQSMMMPVKIISEGKEKVIPSVVIQPASNNEGEGEHEGTMDAEYKEVTDDAALPGPTSEMPELASEEEKAARAPQPAPSAPSASEAFQEVPPGFLYKVETLHDFEAANSDELTLQRGDVVLVVPSDSEADQ
ncbi:AMPH, partial [Cervus elaphus hippelaphus]